MFMCHPETRSKESQKVHWRVIKGNAKHQGQVPGKVSLPLPDPSPFLPRQWLREKAPGDAEMVWPAVLITPHPHPL